MKNDHQNSRDTRRSSSLGDVLYTSREALGLSKLELARRSGVADSTIYRIEQGILKQPRPDVLQAIADELGLDWADLHAAAGYRQPNSLPTFAPYLRSKYRDLPSSAATELEAAFSRIAAKHGYDPSGPRPGDDEDDERADD